MHNLWVDGKSLREFGVWVSGESSFVTAEWQYDRQEIPGRSGDLVSPRKRLANVTVQYPAFIPRDFDMKVQDLRLFLLAGGAAYRRIEDDYSLETYRLGIFAGPMSFEAGFLNKSGKMTLAFDCKPQRFFKSGDFPVQVASGQKLINPGMAALPLIRITGSGDGQLVVGNSVVDITDMAGGITLDCDIQNAYDGTLNLNNNITITGGWPILAAGLTKVSFSGGITAVEITPRWWTL